MTYLLPTVITKPKDITEINNNTIKSIIEKSESVLQGKLTESQKVTLFTIYSKRFEQKLSQIVLEKLVLIYRELDIKDLNSLQLGGEKHLPIHVREQLNALYKEQKLTKMRISVKEEYSILVRNLKRELEGYEKKELNKTN